MADTFNAQRAVAEAHAVLEHERRRNAELAEALQRVSPETYELLTPTRTPRTRSSRLIGLLHVATAYVAGDATEDELRGAVREVEDYLPEWTRRLEMERARAKKARNNKGAA